MMFVIYWLTLALGGVITAAAVTLFVLGLCLERRRRLFLTLGVVAFGLAWVPTAAFFAVQYAMGARPAGWDPSMSQPRAPTPAPLPK